MRLTLNLSWFSLLDFLFQKKVQKLDILAVDPGALKVIQHRRSSVIG